MKKRLTKKLAKKAIAELEAMEHIGPLSSKKIQHAMYEYLFYRPNHPISKSFWEAFNNLNVKVK